MHPTPHVPRHRALLVATLGLLCACDPTKVAEQCVAADLVEQCPVGSNPVLGAQAESACGGSFDSNLVTDGASATGQCGASGSCEFLCQFEVPCTCGVATLTKDAIVCSECQDQSCGDGRCEGTERVACEPGQVGCFGCIEDCAGPTCGDGDCTASESPQTCPQDCASKCTPNASVCIGSQVSKCSADGRTSVELDCATSGQICGGGECVMAGVCGNAVCEPGETMQSCAGDCSTACQPASRACQGAVLVVCSADGATQTEVDCSANGEVCSGGQCRPANVCGNGVCEASEAATCEQDCAAVCGNNICENNEATACPGDCTTCGNARCEAGEITSCPQDCGVCVPSEKQCLGKILRVCNANGTAYDDIDCDDLGLSCARGNCVETGVCGNGICDAGEAATCLPDCAETCGNGVCGGDESFQTCAVDCDPICGDGTCEGNEDSATCSFDCLVGCGDATCSGAEDRVNCPGDCGFCGDSTCQDGAESANLHPPGLLESCAADCVVVGCEVDADCNDDVACTANQCLNESCIYAPNDDLCSGTEKCIRLNGCCPDADGDGYADEACGGSDCNDADGDVHPGALEVCGGGDKNCNGQHKPSLTPAKKLTNTASAKSYLNVFDLGQSLLLGWAGKPTTRLNLELVEVGWDLLAKGPVVTVDEVEVNEEIGTPFTTNWISMAWNPTRQKLAASWVVPGVVVTNQYGTAWATKAAWFGKNGSLDGAIAHIDPVSCGGPFHTKRAYGAIPLGDKVLFSANTFSAYGVQGHEVWELSAAGNVTDKLGTPCGVPTFVASRLLLIDDLVSGLAGLEPPLSGSIVSFDPARSEPPGYAVLDHASSAGGCALGQDGEMLALTCALADKVYYHRATQSGGAFFSEQVMTGTYAPLAIGTSKPALGAAPVVGVALRDSGQNLWFFVRDQTGAEVLEPAIIGGGEAIASAYVMHDGIDFVVVWLAKTGGFAQAYAQRITCE